MRYIACIALGGIAGIVILALAAFVVAEQCDGHLFDA